MTGAEELSVVRVSVSMNVCVVVCDAVGWSHEKSIEKHFAMHLRMADYVKLPKTRLMCGRIDR